MPAHEWDGSRLRFQTGDNLWGDYVDLRAPAGAAGTLVQLLPSNGSVTGTPRRLTDNMENGSLTINVNGRTDVFVTYDLGSTFRIVPFSFQLNMLHRGRYWDHRCNVEIATSLNGPWRNIDYTRHRHGNGSVPDDERNYNGLSEPFRYLKFSNLEANGTSRNNLNDYSCQWTRFFPQAFVP